MKAVNLNENRRGDDKHKGNRNIPNAVGRKCRLRLECSDRRADGNNDTNDLKEGRTPQAVFYLGDVGP